jgi:hypothetical protein
VSEPVRFATSGMPGTPEFRRELAASRERLAALAERVARVRDRLSAGPVAPAAGRPLALPFGGADQRPIEDLELTFRAVDLEATNDGDKPR